MDKNEFEKDLEIDPDQLDVMAALQGELFFKWAEKAAAAKANVDECKFRLEVFTAKLAARARTDPESFGLQKVTEAAIDTAVKTSQKYQEAYEEWIQARADSALLEKAVEALDDRQTGSEHKSAVTALKGIDIQVRDDVLDILRRSGKAARLDDPTFKELLSWTAPLSSEDTT